MRAVLFLVAVAIITWFATGGPIPIVALRPLTPDPSIPTFKQALSDDRALHSAQSSGQLVEDPALRARRAAVVAAGQKLDAAPCDKAARDELRVAATAFLKSQMTGFKDKPTETMTVDGRVVDARGFLNRAATDVVTMAFADGILTRDNLPSPLNMMATSGPGTDLSDYNQRFGCNSSTAKAR